MIRKCLMLVSIIFAALIGVAFTTLVLRAQQPEPTCDLEAMLVHQQEHADNLAHLAEAIESDPDAALQNLYVTGIAYQALAVECGFTHTDEAARLHELEHEDPEHAAQLEVALAVGDPERGRELFNRVEPTTGFACATCHLTDTMNPLIGPGLQGIGDPEHDPSEHAATEATDEPMNMDMGGHDDHAATEEPHDSDTVGHRDDAHAQAEVIDYIRTSILHPSEYIVPGFPDNLMPQTYGEVFSETELNDLIAYLLTL
jgi:hypothetical protein